MFSKTKKINFPNSLAFRLALAYTNAFIVLLMFALALSFASVNSILNHRVNEDLEEDIEEFTQFYQEHGLERVIEEVSRETSTGETNLVFFRLLNPEGKLLYSSDVSQWRNLDQFTDKMLADFLEYKDLIWLTHEFENHEYPSRMAIYSIDNDILMHFGESLEEKLEIMEVLFGVFILMFLFFIPVSIASGWWVTKRSVSGIKEVSSAAVDIQHGQLQRRVSIKDQSSEIRQLADTFNAMANRISSLISEMREMTDNIAHDLRSPIARIRAISEQMLSQPKSIDEHKNAAADTLEECDRLIHMINTTLDVAEAEAGISMANKEEFDLSQLVKEACDLFGALAEEKEIELISTTTHGSCLFQGNRQYLQRMLANILDNAIKYTDAGGKIEVKLDTQNKDYRLVIADSGVGIPESEQSKIFDRFYRCDQSRSQEGCGLGLSFSSAVVKSHGGTIELESHPNQGSVFTVTMPFTPA